MGLFRSYMTRDWSAGGVCGAPCREPPFPSHSGVPQDGTGYP